MLQTRVRVFLNPWSHTVPDYKLVEILETVATTRANHIDKQFESGKWRKNSLGLAILNPDAPIWQPSSETLLATIAIGSEGEKYIVNAIAKAVEHRDHGKSAGYGVYVDLTQSADGDFCWGYSTQVDDTIGGASAQTELQDACEAGHALVTFNYLVREARSKWREAHPDNDWFCDLDQPKELYAEMAARKAPIYDSAG
jgi:hypothetical protein